MSEEKAHLLSFQGISNATFNSSFEHTKGLSVLADLRGSSLHGKGPTLLQIACCQVVWPAPSNIATPRLTISLEQEKYRIWLVSKSGR